jgi:hypothetical protein
MMKRRIDVKKFNDVKFPKRRKRYKQFVIRSVNQNRRVLLHCDQNPLLMCTKRFSRPLAQKPAPLKELRARKAPSKLKFEETLKREKYLSFFETG